MFLLKRPTSTSVEQRLITPDLTPDIIICPQPGFDMLALRKNGYFNSLEHYLGINSSGTFVGWYGNNSIDTFQVMEEISYLKKVLRCLEHI